MTGYGRAAGPVAGFQVSVEVRSLNHRYKDLHLLMPKGWLALEVHAERLLRERIGRGRIECLVRAKAGSGSAGGMALDIERARQVRDGLKKLARVLGSRAKPSLELVAQFEGVLARDEAIEDAEAAWLQLQVLLEGALKAMEAMRRREGADLDRELLARLQELEGRVGEIRTLAPAENEALGRRSAERMRELAGLAEVSEERLLQELSILAERLDVNEELSRLGGHVDHFRALLRREEPVGRELDFLLQEMNREVNTLSSKVRSAPVSKLAVAAKAEIERIRELVQNAE